MTRGTTPARTVKPELGTTHIWLGALHKVMTLAEWIRHPFRRVSLDFTGGGVVDQSDMSWITCHLERD